MEIHENGDFMELKFKLNQKEDCYKIREKVFMEEQGFEVEFDDIDNFCTFITLYDGDQCIGCARFFDGQEEGIKIFGRLAVLKEYRGQKLGTRILKYAEDIMREQDVREIHLHAQCHAVPFYIGLGYVSYGEVELDETVEHIWMKKLLKRVE